MILLFFPRRSKGNGEQKMDKLPFFQAFYFIKYLISVQDPFYLYFTHSNAPKTLNASIE